MRAKQLGFATLLALLWVLAPLAGPAPAGATEATPAPSDGGTVRYIVGFMDKCDGSIEVAILNASDESTTIQVNGEEQSIEPQGIGHYTVAKPGKGKAEVVVKVLKGKGRPDKSKHTWTKPVCATGSPSASASASPAPSAPAVSVTPSTGVGDTPRLALTGVNAVNVAGVGGLLVVGGIALALLGRQRRQMARHRAS